MLRTCSQILISDTATLYFNKFFLQPGMKSKLCVLCSLQFHSSLFNFLVKAITSRGSLKKYCATTVIFRFHRVQQPNNLYGIKALLYCLLLQHQWGKVSKTVGDQMKDFFFCDINLQDTGSFKITSGDIAFFICFFPLRLLRLLHCWAMSFFSVRMREQKLFCNKWHSAFCLPLSPMDEEENHIHNVSFSYFPSTRLPYSYEQVR